MKPNNNGCEGLGKTTSSRLTLCMVLGSLLIVVGALSLVNNSLHIIAKYLTRMSPGTMFYDILNQPNIPGAYVHTYIFNVTNGDKFLSGEDHNLKVEEVGPFTYQELRTNQDFELDEEAGVMRYTPNITTRFIPELSIADPKDVNVTVPNIAMLAMTSYISSFPSWSRATFNLLANRLNSKSMMEVDVYSYLWGYKEPLIQLVHTALPGWITFAKMGILDRLYDSGKVRLELGAKNEDKFLIKKINGEGGLTEIGYADPSRRNRCNSLIDTYEGIVYPVDITPDTPLRVYRSAFCRFLDLEYQGSVPMDFGPEGFVYRFSKTTFNKTRGNECLADRPGILDGITDLSPCFFGLGLGLSNAHFLHGDPKIYERVEGIRPDEQEHGSEIIIDPKLGAVLTTKLTLQVNLIMGNVKFNSAARPFSNLILPVAYFKIIQPQMSEENAGKFWKLYVLLPYIFHTCEVVFIIAGMLLLAFNAKRYYCTRLVNEKQMQFKLDNIKPCNIIQDEPLLDQKIRE
ncbi:scavenger receptor class B member 1-like isoform X1 [Leptidea sinapis]|uniref:scavenger receptor class B member 1-like isoform X1 n=2 Tax=Leptidea sinapis TaxID=189913 RepID=UPI00213522FE|nr:scavenger receptor class B member 1-like isoform X1 [Leptidea sinapis]